MATVTVRAAIHIAGASKELVRALKDECTHSNPDFYKKKNMGMWTGDTPRKLTTYAELGDELLLPRGAMGRLRNKARELEEPLEIRDRRADRPTPWPRFNPVPNGIPVVRPYQQKAKIACMTKEQGIVRSPTGSGKTHIALDLLADIQQRALVIVRDRQLLEQWVTKARRHFGMDAPQLGVVRGGKKHNVGTCLTLALQQTLWAKSFPLEDFAKEHFGAVLVDEVHGAAATTVSNTVGVFPARYRIGFSADETRRDRKEFLVYDLFGDVIADITREEVEGAGYTVPVIVRLVPTEFRADWYANAPPEERDFKKLIDEIIADTTREHLLRTVLKEVVAERHSPALVFTHRREHASRLSEQIPAALKVGCGLMMGGDDSASTFAEALRMLERGTLPLAVGTFNSIGQGIDLPTVLAGVVATPIGANRQYFGQVRGRICRGGPGKEFGYLYYLWDREVFPYVPANLREWNDDRVEIFDHGRSRWVSADDRGGYA